MAGYSGFSMSNNAVAAYENGEKPLSKWRKIDILNEIEKYRIENNLRFSMELLQKINIKELKANFLGQSSRHHTSSHYNMTTFYSINEYMLDNLTDEKIQIIINRTKQKEMISEKPLEEKWKCAFLEWSGSRNYPKATEIIEVGIVKGNWFFRKDGRKKKTTANGFRFIEKVS